MSNTTKIENGHYSFDYNGHRKFFKVNTPSRGRWAGFTFVEVQAGDDYYPVKGTQRTLALSIIGADPAAASRAYGQHIGSCGICGRTLTNEESRAAGIGPVCADKTGY